MYHRKRHKLSCAKVILMSKRIKQTNVEKKIFPALIRLLKEKPFKSITITDICAEAGISRISFYRNYDTKEAIITNEMKKKLAMWRRDFGKQTPEDAVIRFYEYLKENEDMFQTLYNAGLIYTVFAGFYEFFSSKDSPIDEQRYNGAGYTGVIWGFVYQWVIDGMKKTPQEMLAITKNFINYLSSIFDKLESEDTFLNPNLF